MTALATRDAVTPHAGSTQLVIAVLVGIAVLVVLITRYKLHPFLSLTIGSLLVGTIANLPMADTIVGRAGPRMLPWSMALVRALIGLPMFFEIGLVLLMPVILLVSIRSGLSLMRVAIPARAGLSIMHGLVPPHPGPLVAISALKADLGVTLAFGVLVAVRTVIIGGPLFSRFADRWVHVETPTMFVTEREQEFAGVGARAGETATQSGGRGPSAAVGDSPAETPAEGPTGDRRDQHRCRRAHPADVGLTSGRRRCSCWPSAPDRCSSLTSTTRASGW